MGLFLYPPPNNAPVVIINDGGGIIEDFLSKAQQYNLEGRRVEIRGSCRSACVIALSVNNVCVAPGAVVKAHLPYNKWGGQVRMDYVDKMLNPIPTNIKNYLEPRLQVNYTPATTLDYAKLRSFGIPDCGSNKPVVAQSRQMKTGINFGKPTLRIVNPLDAILRFLGKDK